MMVKSVSDRHRKAWFSMNYRVENKYLVTDSEAALLMARLNAAMHQDIHADGSSYEVCSLYFDDLRDRGMDENEAGLDQREKYRIRFYGTDLETLHLERKEKIRGFVRKESCSLSLAEVNALLEDRLPLSPDHRNILNLLRVKSRCCRMQPKVILRYDRTAFVCSAGNVRITFDRNIQASLYCRDFPGEQIRGLTPVLPSGLLILEVKYDEFLPDFIVRLLETGTLQQTAFSKYYWGRLAVGGTFPGSR